MEIINSKEYWDGCFKSGSWDENDGGAQTAFFAGVAYKLLPDVVKDDLTQNMWSIIDVGCALGEAAAFLSEKYPSCHVTGMDFSAEAIARERHPQCEFVLGDVYDERRSFSEL